MGDDPGKLLSEARAAWPEIKLAPDGFAARLAALAATDTEGAPFDAHHVADLYVAWACAVGSPHAIAILEREVIRDVPRFVDRFRGGPAFADEVAQLVREKLLVGASPRIAEYAGRGPLRAWVRVTATRIALDLLRERGAAPERELDDTLAVDGAAGPELELLKARYRGHFQAALEAAIAALSTKQRTLLRMHHVDGFSLDRLATVHRVHRATVARWLADAREEIVTRTHEALGEQLPLSPSDFDSVVALVQSQIGVSVSRLLGPR